MRLRSAGHTTHNPVGPTVAPALAVRHVLYKHPECAPVAQQPSIEQHVDVRPLVAERELPRGLGRAAVVTEVYRGQRVWEKGADRFGEARTEGEGGTRPAAAITATTATAANATTTTTTTTTTTSPASVAAAAAAAVVAAAAAADATTPEPLRAGDTQLPVLHCRAKVR